MDEVNTGLEEHNAVFNSSSPAQLYPSCAQIQIESDFSGSLPEGIKIPDALQHTSPGKTPKTAFVAVALSWHSRD
jgi:hypothetical protein